MGGGVAGWSFEKYGVGRNPNALNECRTSQKLSATKHMSARRFWVCSWVCRNKQFAERSNFIGIVGGIEEAIAQSKEKWS